MNKIYKLVWSQVKNTWVAASEMAKSHGKSNRARGRVTLVAAVLGVLMVTALPTFGVYAADLTAEQKAVYDAVLAKLEADKKVVHYFSVNSDNLAGQNDKSFDDFSGYSNKKATGVQSMAIGRMSRTPVTGAMAVGNHAVAEGFFSVAIGPDALVTGEHITSDQYEALSDEDKQLYAPADTAATSYLKIKMKATKDGQKSFEAEVNQGVAVGRSVPMRKRMTSRERRLVLRRMRQGIIPQLSARQRKLAQRIRWRSGSVRKRHLMTASRSARFRVPKQKRASAGGILALAYPKARYPATKPMCGHRRCPPFRSVMTKKD